MDKLADISLFESYQKCINNSSVNRHTCLYPKSESPITVASKRGYSVFDQCGGGACSKPEGLLIEQGLNSEDFFVSVNVPDLGSVYSAVYSDVIGALEQSNYLNKKYALEPSIFSSDVPITNESVADIRQLGDSIVNGYAQSSAGLLPTYLSEELARLTDTLVEGMTIAYNRLTQAKDTPVNQAECELFMDMQRKYCDNIPDYAKKAKDLFLKDF